MTPQETKIEKKYVDTPLMKQYYSIKAVHPDAILLFRVGDFYETFGDDAIKASGILGITLTRRANGAASYVELAGFPYHAVDTYLPKLVRAGERVAICEQLEDPKLVKGLVKRGVIELVTPGIVTPSLSFTVPVTLNFSGASSFFSSSSPSRAGAMTMRLPLNSKVNPVLANTRRKTLSTVSSTAFTVTVPNCRTCSLLNMK